MERGHFNFVWLFAIVAGGAILFLAIYGALRTGETLKYGADTEAGKSIAILTDPLQAGFAEGSLGKISFQDEARINNICFDDGFGRNDISVSMKSGIGEEWGSPGGAISVRNKYIFSSEKSLGVDYYVFSKAFDFPYEVSDLIFLISDDYCFVGAPDNVVDEITRLNVPKIEFNDCLDGGYVNVCFGGGLDCDVVIYGSCSSGCDSVFDEGVVARDSGDVKYVGNLLYGAIFSDEEIYNCNVRRLLYRAGKIAELFSEKADLMNARGCGTNLKSDLLVWRELVSDADSDDLMSLSSIVDEIDRKNSRELCRAW